VASVLEMMIQSQALVAVAAAAVLNRRRPKRRDDGEKRRRRRRRRRDQMIQKVIESIMMKMTITRAENAKRNQRRKHLIDQQNIDVGNETHLGSGSVTHQRRGINKKDVKNRM